MSLTSIPHIIPVLSGKGGVGKSSVTTQLALSLSLAGYTVSVLDIDLTGPSIPRFFGVEKAKIKQAPGGWLPVQIHPSTTISDASAAGNERKVGALYCMSLGFLLQDRGDAVVWRGPKKTAMVKQLLSDVLWPPETEYLIIDTPPGTSDEHISMATQLLDPERVTQSQTLSAVIVTTPQAIATADVRKELTFCQKVGLKVAGVVENMAGFVCPCCGEVTNVFSKGGGQVMARDWGVQFLGSVPLDGDGWGRLIEEGKRPQYGATEEAQTPRIVSNGGTESSGSAIPNGDHSKGSPSQAYEKLVEKYTSCSLCPPFREMTKVMTENPVGNLPQPPD
ncbi:MAG: cytosolic Fe-S cluster assembly factor cfd1 [Chrysothrix sp. TS-e1954]|nr:MAG: cytosolic Fe-S cluster assembly factor cfd1 [Chrysothrix sp. TS-e1954]